jgi:RNA polymerase sigma-70 factor (ECF subfamily)
MPPDGRFRTTRWSLVLAAGAGEGAAATEALASLCELYWYPIYSFVRRQGASADEAADLTQGFFAHVLEHEAFRNVRPERGRFRSFLLACLRHFLANERDRVHTSKRGGGLRIVPLDTASAEGRWQAEPREELTPEKIFDRRWAEALIDRALHRLRDEHIVRGKGAMFGELKGFLTGDADSLPYERVASALGSTEGAVKVAVHRLRRRFRDLLVEEVTATVADPRDVKDEIRHLLQSVTSTAAANLGAVP